MTGVGAFVAKAASLIPEADPAFLDLLERRLAALQAAIASETPFPDALRGREASAVAQSLLRHLEASWDDGDENLVRATLGIWGGTGTCEIARSLVAAAEELGRIHCRRGTVAFFLWEMESLLRGLAPLEL